jgi:hypothetical protein
MYVSNAIVELWQPSTAMFKVARTGLREKKQTLRFTAWNA